jgi:protein TonB
VRLAQPTFADAFLSANRMPGIPRGAALACSMAFQILLLAALIVVPLWFISGPELKNFAVTMLLAPPPPPAAPISAPAPVVAAQPAPRKTFVQRGKLVLPMAIPKHAAVIREAPLPPEIGANGVAGGVYGGLPADLAGIVGGTTEPAPPPPPLPAAAPAVISRPKGPLRVGGDVKAPRIIHRVEPQYPTLARQARIEGDVVLSAMIDSHGNVVEAKVVSGPPMLYPASLAAVREWKFEPTYLNGEPWPIHYEVTLHFRIGARRVD